MANLSDYFQREAYKPRYSIGDRVRGCYQGQPIVGTVGNDRRISLESGPEVTVHLDLPIQMPWGVKYVVLVRHQDIEPLL
jgi:hypothetical protein